MELKSLGKLAATLMLGAALTGCIDATVDVEVTSETTARMTLAQVMGADFYAMMKMETESEGEGADESDAPMSEGFCDDGELTEHVDGSATCTIVEEGDFETLAALNGDDNSIQFASAGPGLVRVSFPTADMRSEVGAEDDMDEETRKMMEAFFTGHAITISISGGEITETNMTRSEDRQSARHVLPFLDLINGTVELPDELFAIVKAP
jgi:hypothetical protein